MTDLQISVVIPVHNEEQTVEQCIRSAVQSFLMAEEPFSRSEVEFLIVDSRSSDDTPNIVSRLRSELTEQGVQVYSLMSDIAGRAQQMNFGAAAARGATLVFLHSDTRLHPGISCDLRQFLRSKHSWGFCRIDFDSSTWRFRLLKFMINLRSRLSSISTGDQTQFVKAEVFRGIGGFPTQPLMEDIELSKTLRGLSNPYISATHSITSARKWLKEGFWRTVFLMWQLRYAYWRGASSESIHRRYYGSN